MDILKNQIDVDSILLSLYSKSTYTDLLLSLLRNPTPDILSKIVINYLNKMLTDLKYLIKMKYNRLTPEIQKNIIKIVLLLLGFGINVDTIIINLLRRGFTNFPVEHKYFKEFKGSLPFIKFHHGEKSSLPPLSACSSLITFDMESDILFMSTVDKNIKFYLTAFIGKYKNKIEDTLKFISAKGLIGKNVEYMVCTFSRIFTGCNDISYKYCELKSNENGIMKDSKSTLMKDNKSVIDNKSTLMRDIKNTVMNDNKNIKNTVKCNNENISTPQDILLLISDLSFPKYYSLIQDMKNKRSPIIDPTLYKEVVFSSFRYDNYVQVYLWKILVYQKILFDIEVEIEECDLKTEESLEGYDIYLNIH